MRTLATIIEEGRAALADASAAIHVATTQAAYGNHGLAENQLTVAAGLVGVAIERVRECYQVASGVASEARAIIEEEGSAPLAPGLKAALDATQEWIEQGEALAADAGRVVLAIAAHAAGLTHSAKRAGKDAQRWNNVLAVAKGHQRTAEGLSGALKSQQHQIDDLKNDGPGMLRVIAWAGAGVAGLVLLRFLTK